MTPERQSKRVIRALRAIPADAITPFITTTEAGGDGLWCLVGGELRFVHNRGEHFEIAIDDPLIPAQLVRWLRAQPDRIHLTHEAAVNAVRSLLAARSDDERRAAADLGPPR